VSTPTTPLKGLASALVVDALDQIGFRDQALDPAIVPLFPEARLAGRARPVRVSAADVAGPSPYDAQMAVVEALEPGDVLVVAVDPGLRVATWGELFSCAAMGQGAIGVLTDGLIRDTSQIVELAFPVFARGASPLDTLGRADMVAFDEPLTCGGIAVRRGDGVVADRDGAVIIPAEGRGRRSRESQQGGRSARRPPCGSRHPRRLEALRRLLIDRRSVSPRSFTAATLPGCAAV